jgi:hypothetical protein
MFSTNVFDCNQLNSMDHDNTLKWLVAGWTTRVQFPVGAGILLAITSRMTLGPTQTYAIGIDDTFTKRNAFRTWGWPIKPN